MARIKLRHIFLIVLFCLKWVLSGQTLLPVSWPHSRGKRSTLEILVKGFHSSFSQIDFLQNKTHSPALFLKMFPKNIFSSHIFILSKMLNARESIFGIYLFLKCVFQAIILISSLSHVPTAICLYYAFPTHLSSLKRVLEMIRSPSHFSLHHINAAIFVNVNLTSI